MTGRKVPFAGGGAVARRLLHDRLDAGRALAALLPEYAGRDDVVVFGLPRGGVPVAYEVAMALHAPLDVVVVRKLRAPGRSELALGAIASGGVVELNEQIIEELDVSAEYVRSAVLDERRELERRERAYRSGRAMLDPSARIAVLVDDGLATGATMRAAITALRSRQPARLVVGVPVAPPGSAAALAGMVDEFVPASVPSGFRCVGDSYLDFSPTTDAEVVDFIARSRPVQEA